MDLLELMRSAKASGDLSALCAALPYAQFLGLEVSVEQGELWTRMRFSDKLVGDPTLPALHGGTLGALLEFAAVFQVLWQAETILLPKTINVTVAYLRSGRPKDTYAHGVITRLGRRVATVDAFAWQDDRSRPIASAVAHFLVKPATELTSPAGEEPAPV